MQCQQKALLECPPPDGGEIASLHHISTSSDSSVFAGGPANIYYVHGRNIIDVRFDNCTTNNTLHDMSVVVLLEALNTIFTLP